MQQLEELSQDNLMTGNKSVDHFWKEFVVTMNVRPRED